MRVRKTHKRDQNDENRSLCGRYAWENIEFDDAPTCATCATCRKSEKDVASFSIQLPIPTPEEFCEVFAEISRENRSLRKQRDDLHRRNDELVERRREYKLWLDGMTEERDQYAESWRTTSEALKKTLDERDEWKKRAQELGLGERAAAALDARTALASEERADYMPGGAFCACGDMEFVVPGPCHVRYHHPDYADKFYEHTPLKCAPARRSSREGGTP